jgi:hypothetical protein
MKTELLIAAARFHKLAETAQKYGGLWVSAAGGTANVVAGELARLCSCEYQEAHRALDITGGENWYADLAAMQPWAMESEPSPRWDARTIAKAAARFAD